LRIYRGIEAIAGGMECHAKGITDDLKNKAMFGLARRLQYP